MPVNAESMLDVFGQIIPGLCENSVLTINTYLTVLRQWNRKINLTRLSEKEWDDLIVYESLSLLKLVPGVLMNQPDCCWMDMGTGAGIPGLLVAAVFPEQPVVLVDSRSKKTDFVQYASSKMKLKNVIIIHERLERCDSLSENLPGKVSVFFSRALTEPEALLTYADPYASTGSILISPRSGTMGRKNVKFNMSDRLEWSTELIPVTVPSFNRSILCMFSRKE